MKYSVADCLADYGFQFLEKVHEPIFLVHRRGQLSRMNEAARKLLSVGRLSTQKLDQLISDYLGSNSLPTGNSFRRFTGGKKQRHFITRSFKDSDYVLVEVIK